MSAKMRADSVLRDLEAFSKDIYKKEIMRGVCDMCRCGGMIKVDEKSLKTWLCETAAYGR